MTRKTLPTTHRATLCLVGLVGLLLALPTSAALQGLSVPGTDMIDASEAYLNPIPETYVYQFANPPFTFANDSQNISAFVTETKTDWGSIPRTSPDRHVFVNVTITNATQTHYVLYENLVEQTFGFWRTDSTVTIDGVRTYKLMETFSVFHPIAFSYRTSHILGLARNVTLFSWNAGNTDVGASGLCFPCQRDGEIDVRAAQYSNNYSSAVFVSNPFEGQGIFNALRAGSSSTLAYRSFWAFNLTAPTGMSVTISYASTPPKSQGFVYQFITPEAAPGSDSVAQYQADGVQCNGYFTGLIYSWFGFCPDVPHTADYIAGFVSGLLTFPLKLVGNQGSSAGSIAESLSDLISTVVGLYTFTLALILISPVQLITVVSGLISGFSAYFAALRGDPLLAIRGTFLGVKWFGIIIIGYFVVLFYVAKGLVWLVVQIVALIISAINAARSFFKVL